MDILKDNIRWKQRFNNYISALRTVEEAIDLSKERSLSNLEKQGLIKGFEFTLELAWKMLKDYFEEEEVPIEGIKGSKNIIRTAFKHELIEQGDVWMKMIEDRNKSSHAYDLETAELLVKDIINLFYAEFKALAKRFTKLHDENEA
jgi:nucleotidyltransferase substrate binding protein (TIGR01987 family)